jgi:predicted AlkP superfamily pyrophosphatase or phosphodiesterase
VTQPAGPKTSAAIAAEQRLPVTILVSIDGLGANRLGKGLTPRLDALAAGGVRGSMRPSFPANTFPNHITLVTGLRPGRHGIVDQRMRDPARPGVTFRNSDPLTNRDPFWWNGIDPIWLQAERAGIRTGAMYWVASDVAINGQRPSLWWPFDNAITSAQRVDTILDWLRRPANPPQFLLLYFDVVDRAAHNLGYDSAEEHAAIAEVDAEIGRLIDTLATLRQPANVLVVSDHGMAAVPPEHIRPLSDVIDPTIMESITEGPLLAIYPKQGQDVAVAARLSRPPAHLTCWGKKDIPARFHYGTHPRVPPFLCMADVGWTFPENPKSFTKGDHGFDPDSEPVAAVFIASGPAFRPGRVLPRFSNTDVYPLLRDLLGLPPAQAIDGSDVPFRGVLVNR